MTATSVSSGPWIGAEMTVSEDRTAAHKRRIKIKDDLRKQILNLKDHGCSNVEIASALRISESQVRGVLQAEKNS